MRARPGLFLLPLLAAACSPARDGDARDAFNDAIASARATRVVTGATGMALPAALMTPRTPGQPPRSGSAAPDRAAALIGQPARHVRDALGDPDLVRGEGPAEVWLYSGETCHLDVMVYRDPAGGEPRVAFAAARAAGLTRTSENACLHEIAGGPAAPPTGPRFSQVAGGES